MTATEARTNATRLRAADLLPMNTAVLEHLPNGAVYSRAGNQGFALFGPYMAAGGGVYRITCRAFVEGGAGTLSYFDMLSDGRYITQRRYHEPFVVYVYLTTTPTLEFRFAVSGEAVLIESVEMVPLLLDDEPASAPRIRALIEETLRHTAEPSAVFALADRLADLGLGDEAEAHRDAFTSSRPDAVAVQAFREINMPGRPPLSQDLDARLTPESVARAFTPHGFTTYDLFDLSPAQEAELTSQGCVPDLLKASRLRRSSVEPRREWQTKALAGQRSFNTGLFRGLAYTDYGNQAEPIVEGEISAYCPMSGRLLKSRHAFVVHDGGIPFFLYRFEGEQVFYLCTGAHGNTRYFLFFPLTNIIVVIADPSERHSWIPGLLVQFKVNLTLMRHEAREYLDAQTRPALLFGNSNLGHFMWNDLSGLHHVIASGWLPRVAQLVALPRQFIDARQVFPELTDLPYTELASGAEAFAYCLRNRLLPVRAASPVVTDAFSERLREYADRRGSIPAAVRDRRGPLIWMNLRAHSKVWTDQVEGNAALLNAAQEAYGDISVVLDGMNDCADIAAQIRARLDPNVTVYDGIGVPLADTLKWAFEVDCFACPVGTGMAMVTWWGKKHGVAHAEHEHMTHLAWWPDVREGAPAPLSPSLDQITDVGGGFYCNYEVDWRVLWPLLTQVLDSLGYKRT